MLGLGYRRDMRDWDLTALGVDFVEVVPENWIWRDRAPLHRLQESGWPVHLHGVSLNLGGPAPIDTDFLRELRGLIDDLGVTRYSDHLAASGDAHQLHDLFPVAFTTHEARRVGDRIRQVQDALGMQIAVENTTWYSHVGDLPETEFLMAVIEHASCALLLDLNNITVNHKNHGGPDLAGFIERIDPAVVSYVHVAGHEFDARFDLFIDTHSRGVEPDTAAAARALQARHGTPILLEWDNDLPDADTFRRELQCLKPSSTT